MITLYHSIGARSLRPLWALEELQLPYLLEWVDFPPKLKAPQYLAINPIGSLPFLVDGDTRINESAAILEYLAARYDRDGQFGVAPDDRDFGAWLNWVHYGEASLTTPLATIFKYSIGLPKEQRLPAVVEEFKAFFRDRLQPVDIALQAGDYLCAGRFTMADISVGYALYLAKFLRLEDLFSPAVKAYFARLAQRQAFAAAVAKTAPTAG